MRTILVLGLWWQRYSVHACIFIVRVSRTKAHKAHAFKSSIYTWASANQASRYEFFFSACDHIYYCCGKLVGFQEREIWKCPIVVMNVVLNRHDLPDIRYQQSAISIYWRFRDGNVAAHHAIGHRASHGAIKQSSAHSTAHTRPVPLAPCPRSRQLK